MEDQELLLLLMELNETVEDGTLSEATRSKRNLAKNVLKTCRIRTGPVRPYDIQVFGFA